MSSGTCTFPPSLSLHLLTTISPTTHNLCGVETRSNGDDPQESVFNFAIRHWPNLGILFTGSFKTLGQIKKIVIIIRVLCFRGNILHLDDRAGALGVNGTQNILVLNFFLGGDNREENKKDENKKQEKRINE